MPKDNAKRDSNRGQTAPREVYDADGNPVAMTQTEWRNRDKTLGLNRPDDDVNGEDGTAEDVAVVEQTPIEETEGEAQG